MLYSRILIQVSCYIDYSTPYSDKNMSIENQNARTITPTTEEEE